MKGQFIFSNNNNIFKRVASMKIKSYKMDAIFRYADYYIDNLDELELDLIPDDFFEKFKDDLDWSYITTTKLLTNEFIIKFADVISIEQLCKFYPFNKELISFFNEKQTSLFETTLILNCNIDLEGLELLEDNIASYFRNLKIQLDKIGIDIRTHEVAKEKFSKFPNDVYAKYMLKEIEKCEIPKLLFEGMQDCFRSAMVRKYSFRHYKPLWEPELKGIPLENYLFGSSNSTILLSENRFNRYNETRIIQQQKTQNE